jgi:hypothetical protein
MKRTFSKLALVFAVTAPAVFAQYTYSLVDTTMAGPPSGNWTSSNYFGNDMLSGGSEVRAVIVSPNFEFYLGITDCYNSCTLGGISNFTTGYQLVLGSGGVVLYSTWLNYNTYPTGLLYYTLTSATIPTVQTGSVVRAIVRSDPSGGYDIILYVNNVLGLFYHDTTPAASPAGSVGFFFQNGPAATFVSEGDVGPLDTVAQTRFPLRASALLLSSTM